MNRVVIAGVLFLLAGCQNNQQADSQPFADPGYVQTMAAHIVGELNSTKNVIDGLKVAVVPLSDSTKKSDELSESLTARIVTELGRHPRVRVVGSASGESTRRVLEEIKAQADMQKAGLIDPATVKKASILGVDAILIGKLTDGGPVVNLDCNLYDVSTGLSLAGAGTFISKQSLRVYRQESEDEERRKTAEVRRGRTNELASPQDWQRLRAAIATSPQPLTERQVYQCLGTPDDIRQSGIAGFHFLIYKSPNGIGKINVDSIFHQVESITLPEDYQP